MAQALLGGLGPLQIRAMQEQQLAQYLAPKGGGRILAAGSPGAGRDMGSQIGSGLAGLGAGLEKLGAYMEKNKAKEEQAAALENQRAMVAKWSETLPAADRMLIDAIASTPEGLNMLAGKLTERVFPEQEKPQTVGQGQVLVGSDGKVIFNNPAAPKPLEQQNIVNPRTGEFRTITKGDPVPVGFVLGGNYTPDKRSDGKVTLFKGGKSVTVDPNSPQYQQYIKIGFSMDPGQAPDDGKGFDQEKKLRDEFNRGADEFVKVRDAYSRIVRSGEDPSAAGDLALIYNYMKMLDPGSTVMAGEYATAQNAGGVGSRIVALYNNLRDGQRLTPEQRADFLGRAEKLYGQQETFYKAHEGRYRALAEAYSLNPNRVVYGMGEGTPSSQKPKPETQEASESTVDPMKIDPFNASDDKIDRALEMIRAGRTPN